MTGRLAGSGGFGRALLSVAAGLLIAGILMRLSGYDPRAAYAALATGATGLQNGKAVGPNDIAFGLGHWTAHLNKFILAQSLARVTPLLFAGLAVAIGLKAGLFNIGAQGQMVMGALAAAVVGSLDNAAIASGRVPESAVPVWAPFLDVPVTLLVGAAAGALWGALAGLLKAARGVHEVISTIMLNYVAANIAAYLVTHSLKDPHSMAAQTPIMARSTWLTPLVPGSNFTIGLLVAVLAAAGMTFLIGRTALGFEVRAVGLGTEAAGTAGIPTARTMALTMALSGALAGLAGAIEVMGIHHRYVEGVAANYGFDGIAVALLGGLNGGGVALSALFFGALANGAAYMQLQTDVPDSISVVVQAMVILFIGVRVFRQRTVNPLLAAVSDTDERTTEDDSL